MTGPERSGGGRMTSTPPRRRLRVEEIGRSLLVSVNSVHIGCRSVAGALPADPGRVCVVMPDAAVAADPELAARLRDWVPMRYESVRLVAPRAAVASPGASQPPAQTLCDLLDAEVIAPDGELAAVPGGHLFVPAGPDGSARGWWRFRPGRPPQLGGRRYPVPEWERALADFAETGVAELAIEEIPAGLWVHRTGGPAGRPDDLAFAVTPQPDTVALLVSRPGDQPLRAADLRRVVAQTPERLRDRLVVIPYGDHPVADAPLGAVVSLALNRTLRVSTGLPLPLAGRGNQVTAVGADGEPAWTPFAREVSWRPHGGARILSWGTPADQLLPAGPAQFLLNDRWVVEVVEAGLWIHEIDRAEGASLIRQLPLEAEHCTVVIGVCDDAQRPPPWRAIRRLLRRLPEQAYSRLRLTVPAPAGEWFASAVTRGCRRLLRERPITVLTLSGAVLPWGAAPAARRRVVRRERVEPSRSQPVVPSRRPTAVAATPANDVSKLLDFVDQIRRTPAWDEMPAQPAEVAPKPRTAGSAGSSGVSYPERVTEPVAQPGEQVPAAAQEVRVKVPVLRSPAYPEDHERRAGAR